MKLKIGADPEFEFSNGEELMPACELVGYGQHQELGTDCSQDTAEIRPKAGNYREVANRIDKILGRAAGYGYDGYAGSGTHISTGGHIHFSGIKPSAELNKRLAMFITKPLNSVSDTTIRKEDGYGRLNEDVIRTNSHGWEYRSAASWLSTPILTKGALAIAWVLGRATKKGDIKKLNNVEQLLEYSYKSEAIHIRLFYDAIKNYKANNTKLEKIEMFAAWNKKNRKRPMVNIRWDDYSDVLNHIKIKVGKIKCYRPLWVYGQGSHWEVPSEPKRIYIPKKDIDNDLKKEMKKLNVGIRSHHYFEKWSLGLSYKLRKNSDLSAKVVKYMVKYHNKRFKEEQKAKQCVV